MVKRKWVGQIPTTYVNLTLATDSWYKLDSCYISFSSAGILDILLVGRDLPLIETRSLKR
jgi:hypothetical protein